MTESSIRRPGPRTWAALAVSLAVVATIAVVVAMTGQQRAPQPAATTADRTAPSSDEPAPATEPGETAPPADMAAPVAAPVSVAIPAIDVTSDLLRLDLNEDGTVQVPPLGPDDQAGWYQRGPAPGAVGPAVLLGHVDSARYGPGIFFDLGALRAGDEVSVSRADGTSAVFAVDRVERHPKDDFPTIEVYGDTGDSQLRLITCGGDFDSSARSYEDNVIVFASLIGTRPA